MGFIELFSLFVFETEDYSNLFLFLFLMSDCVIGEERKVPQSTVDRLPCEIKYNGSAPVSDYFVVNDDNKIKEAMLRGRLLKGERVSLPSDIEGFQFIFEFYYRFYGCEFKNESRRKQL